MMEIDQNQKSLNILATDIIQELRKVKRKGDKQ